MRPVDTFSVCFDCYYYAANGHADDTTPERDREIEAGFTKHGPDLVAGDDLTEFSWAPCELCGSSLGGSRHEVHKLGNDDAGVSAELALEAMSAVDAK